MREVAISLGSVVAGAVLALAIQWLQLRSERAARLATRWDEVRLSTYSKYSQEVRAVRQRVNTLVSANPNVNPFEDDWVRDRLRNESLLLEEMALVASSSVREQVAVVHHELRVALEVPVDLARLKRTDGLVGELHRRCRKELAIEG